MIEAGRAIPAPAGQRGQVARQRASMGGGAADILAAFVIMKVREEAPGLQAAV